MIIIFRTSICNRNRRICTRRAVCHNGYAIRRMRRGRGNRRIPSWLEAAQDSKCVLRHYDMSRREPSSVLSVRMMGAQMCLLA